MRGGSRTRCEGYPMETVRFMGCLVESEEWYLGTSVWVEKRILEIGLSNAVG